MSLTRDELETLADLLADRLCERLSLAPPTTADLVDAAELAEILKVSRGTVYEHQIALGVIPIGERGDGRRPRLRFDRARAVSAWASLHAAEPPTKPTAAKAKGRRRAARAAVDLLPIRGES